MFIPGLVFFLLAHLMYLWVFISTPGKNSVLSSRVYLLIPVLLFGIGLIVFLYNDLGEMRIPVIMYAVVILLMLSGAINRIEKVNRKSYWLVLAGAILFVISDSFIAINKFSMPFEGLINCYYDNLHFRPISYRTGIYCRDYRQRFRRSFVPPGRYY